jgi:hypothetical protein
MIAPPPQEEGDETKPGEKKEVGGEKPYKEQEAKDVKSTKVKEKPTSKSIKSIFKNLFK